MSIFIKIKNRINWAFSYLISWFYKIFFQKPIVKNIEETIRTYKQ